MNNNAVVQWNLYNADTLGTTEISRLQRCPDFPDSELPQYVIKTDYRYCMY